MAENFQDLIICLDNFFVVVKVKSFLVCCLFMDLSTLWRTLCKCGTSAQN